MNTKKLQATQFQCSWFITTEVPGTQIRISFEKLDFGADKSSTCTQQFLEIIDIKLGKSQGRICGDKHKRIGDYVSVGQRVRIDIQGEEGLVEKIRGKKEPFIISYKLVREPPGFRVGGSPSKNKDLTSTVKKTVGVAVDKTNTRFTIYGTKNQPGKDLTNLTPDDPNESRTSLTIWQVVIIIVVAFAIISCIIGVVIKRMIFDKKKKEEYLNLEASKISESNKKADAMILPGLASKISMDSEKKPPKSEHKPKKIKKTPETPAYENLQRSTSKPEGTVKKPPQKVKRHNSHGDATTKTKTAKHRAKTTERQKTKWPP
uniref:uncharacterized protein LOC120339432 n=1 Tax=Styela clava TaxID=7725 RepID=UPI001939C3AF|nr:uncharacterized protein LOC120339432 [Styela clava]